MSTSAPGSLELRPVEPLKFLLFSIGALVTIALVTAHAPSRLKLIGLFSAAVGVAGGAAVAVLAGRYRMPRVQAVLAAAALVPFMLAGYATESFRVWRQARADEVTENLLRQPGGRQLLDRVSSDERPTNKVEADLLHGYRLLISPGPAAFLDSRLSALPVSLTWWAAAVLAGGEFLLGWGAGVVTAAVFANRRDLVEEAAR